MFLFSGLVMVVLALLAFTTKSYRILSAEYAGTTESVPAVEAGAEEQAAADPRR